MSDKEHSGISEDEINEFNNFQKLKKQAQEAGHDDVASSNLAGKELDARQMHSELVEIERAKYLSPEQARAIMGQDQYFGPEALKAHLGIELETKDLPTIPFSALELKEAKERGEHLVLPIDKAPDGTPLTMQRITELAQPILNAGNQGKALYDTNWYQNESFYSEEVPRSGWVLVSKEPLPSATDKNYVGQTRAIIEYLKRTVFKDQPIPQDYQLAIDEFEQYMQFTFPDKTDEEINMILRGTDWQMHAESLTDLSISKLARGRISEAYLESILSRDLSMSDTRFSDTYTWTSSRASDGRIVAITGANTGGADINEWAPSMNSDHLSVLISRRGTLETETEKAWKTIWNKASE